MQSNNGFYEYIRKEVLADSDNEIKELSKSDLMEIQKELSYRTNFFPKFPDIELIADLSRENYERKKCTGEFVFLPFPQDEDLSVLTFKYANDKMSFKKDNIRLLRKVLEALDDSHKLVFAFNDCDNNYYIHGIVASNDECRLKNFYSFKILGYLKLSAKCKDFNLFDYDAGYYFSYEHSKIELEKQIIEAVSSYKRVFEKTNGNKLEQILRAIVKENRGTSLVIFNTEEIANTEVQRLCRAGRGFSGEKVLAYEELLDNLAQFIKVDGGLILDSELRCYAYGCIFDGVVDEGFNGLLAYGSRHNSTWLYIYQFIENKKKYSETDIESEENLEMRKNMEKSMGIIFSDDGGVKYVNKDHRPM